MSVFARCLISIVFVSSFGEVSADFILSPIPHRRSSPNEKYELDYNPKTNVHTMYVKARPNVPLWNFEDASLALYDTDDTDRSLFVANNGQAVAIIDLDFAFDDASRFPEDDSGTLFTKIQILGRDGVIGEHRVRKSLPPLLAFLEFPVEHLSERLEWLFEACDKDVNRSGETIVTTNYSPMSIGISINTGDVVTRFPNPRFWLFIMFVYGVPGWVFIGWLRGRKQQKIPLVDEPSAKELWRTHLALVYLNTIVVAFVLAVFTAFWAIAEHTNYLPYAMIDRICGTCCKITLVLIPLTIIVTAVRRLTQWGPIDVIAPWLALLGLAFITSCYVYTFLSDPLWSLVEW